MTPIHEAFISHSTKDKTWADAACAVLEGHKIRCWIAPRDITPGTEWGAAINDGIDACKIMVLIFSTNANDSAQVRREVELAISKGMPVIPCRVEDVLPLGAMKYALSNTHWLDAFTPPVEGQLTVLAKSVQALLGKRQESSDQETAEAVASASQLLPVSRTAARRRRWRMGAVAAAGALVVGGLVVGYARTFKSNDEIVKRQTDSTEAAVTPSGQETPGDSTAPKEQGNVFVALFNGKDLTGWVMVDKTPSGWAEKALDPHRWGVVGGRIFARGKGSAALTYLAYQRDYSDFVLEFDFRATRAPTRGAVAYHAKDNRTSVVALFNETNPSGTLPGGIRYPSGKYEHPKKKALLRGLNQWNHIELTVRNGRLRGVINGVEVQKARADEEEPGNHAATGRIGFAVYDGDMEFRNIRISDRDASK
ncbi:MAG: family 16 glycoside hydrolase [Gemmataceae bacterium]